MNTVGIMSVREFNKQGVSIRLSPCKPNSLVKVFLLLLSGLCVLFPLSILFIPQISVSFGYFTITLAIFGGSAIFFFRKYLWNYYGAEVFELGSKGLLQYNDYRFFRDNERTMSFNTLQVGYAMLDNPDQVLIYPDGFKPEERVFLGFVLDGEEAIRSETSVNTEDVKYLVDVLKQKQKN